MRRLTKEEFIARGKVIHKNKYNYDEVVYVNNNTKVKLTCTLCDEIGFGTPANHLNGQDVCKSCITKKKKISAPNQNKLQDIIYAAELYHGDKYDYSLCKEYINGKTDMPIICVADNEIFFMSMNKHILHKKQGCPDCPKPKSMTTKIFIERASIIHNNEYDYSDVGKITNTRQKVSITHKICKLNFFQSITSHIHNAQGCPICGEKQRIAVRTTADSFKEKASKIHNDEYDYSLINDENYKGVNPKVPIIHKKCKKSNMQAPSSHLQGHGCPFCIPGVSKGESEWLDSINIPNENRQYSIFVGNKYIYVDGFDPITNTVYEYYGDWYHGNPNIYDPNGYNDRVHKTYGQLYRATVERELIITSLGYKIVIMWEQDWKSKNKILKQAAKQAAKQAIKKGRLNV